MKKTLLGIIGIAILAIIIVFTVNEWKKYDEAKKIKEASANYNEKQKKCEVVGITNNYIYLLRLNSDNEGIEGAKWEVTNAKGKLVGTFTTNDEGNGGLVGLDYGEYYIQEKEVPENYNIYDTKYKVVISSSDTSYSLIASDELKRTSILLVVTDEKENPIEGYKYEILDSQGELLKELTTNKSGLAGLKNIPAGTYYLQGINRETEERMELKVDGENITRKDLVYTLED